MGSGATGGLKLRQLWGDRPNSIPSAYFGQVVNTDHTCCQLPSFIQMKFNFTIFITNISRFVTEIICRSLLIKDICSFSAPIHADGFLLASRRLGPFGHLSAGDGYLYPLSSPDLLDGFRLFKRNSITLENSSRENCFFFLLTAE